MEHKHRESNDQCNFVNDLHNLWIEVEIVLNTMASRNKSEKEDTKNLKNISYKLLVENNFTLINQWSISMIKQYDTNNDRDLLKLAYNLYIILNSENHINRYNLKPLLYTIMTHLNDIANRRILIICCLVTSILSLKLT